VLTGELEQGRHCTLGVGGAALDEGPVAPRAGDPHVEVDQAPDLRQVNARPVQLVMLLDGGGSECLLTGEVTEFELVVVVAVANDQHHAGRAVDRPPPAENTSTPCVSTNVRSSTATSRRQVRSARPGATSGGGVPAARRGPSNGDTARCLTAAPTTPPEVADSIRQLRQATGRS
jgi:hypothetical protein